MVSPKSCDMASYTTFVRVHTPAGVTWVSSSGMAAAFQAAIRGFDSLHPHSLDGLLPTTLRKSPATQPFWQEQEATTCYLRSAGRSRPW